MESEIVSALPQLGIAGAAIWVMYLMYKDSSARFAEKDALLLEQVEKHSNSQDKHQQYIKDVHISTMIQLNNASRVIEDNIKAYERVIAYIDKK